LLGGAEPVSQRFAKGEFVEMDGLPAVIIGVHGDPGVPEEHLAVWFGEPRAERKSKGGKGRVPPEVWTIPEELFQPSPPAIWKH
jgi:hypothetical protein